MVNARAYCEVVPQRRSLVGYVGEDGHRPGGSGAIDIDVPYMVTATATAPVVPIGARSKKTWPGFVGWSRSLVGPQAIHVITELSFQLTGVLVRYRYW